MTKDEVFNRKVKPSEVTVDSGSKFLGATFLYVTLAIAITFVVAFVLGFIFQNAILDGNVEAFKVFIYAIVIGLILYVPTLIWIQISALRNGKGMGVALVLYSSIVGIMLSSTIAFIDLPIILTAFGTTLLAFAVMALIAWTSKKNLSGIGLLGTGLLMGSILILLINFIFYFIFPRLASTVNIVVESVIFLAMLLITTFDLNRVKQIAMNGGADKNVALLSALSLYVDFIYVFIKVLEIVIRIFGNRD